MRIKKIISAISSVAVLSCLLMVSAYAGTTYESYSTTVASMNGSGYTSYQTKAVSGANGYINSTNVGGTYVVDARMQSSSGNGSWLRDVDDGTSAELPGNSNQTKGSSVRLQFSNDWNTLVSVQVNGNWRSY